MRKTISLSKNELEWRLSRNASLLRRTDGKFIRAQEKRMAKRVALLFRKQANWLIEALKDVVPFKEGEQNALEFQELETLLASLPFGPDVAEAVVGVMKTSVTKGGKTSTKALNLGQYGITFDALNAKALQFLGGKLSHELSNFRGNINQTTVTRISEILAEAAKTGQSYSKTAQLIRDQTDAGVFSQARAELIATREVGIAYEEGKRIPVQEFKQKFPGRVIEKAWQTVNDSKVTPTHKLNQQKGWIFFEERWPSPPNGTGDLTAPASDHPRCRCFTKYRIQPA